VLATIYRFGSRTKLWRSQLRMISKVQVPVQAAAIFGPW
jgi:hypothetical protein